jgi:hypothetical protein
MQYLPQKYDLINKNEYTTATAKDPFSLFGFVFHSSYCYSWDNQRASKAATGLWSFPPRGASGLKSKELNEIAVSNCRLKRHAIAISPVQFGLVFARACITACHSLVGWTAVLTARAHAPRRDGRLDY